jgi:hypothetical protein
MRVPARLILDAQLLVSLVARYVVLEKRPPRKTIRDGQKGPAAEGGRYSGRKRARGRGEPRPYKGKMGTKAQAEACATCLG